MNLRQLRFFVAVAEHSSIHAAARQLHVTQPAVTRAVRELESSLDVMLIHRGTRGVELTEYGRTLLQRAQVIFEEARRAEEELVRMRDGEGGAVTAAISAVAGLTVLPRALAAFRARMPRAALSFSEASLPISKEELALGRLDFVVLHEYANEGDDGFARELLFDSPLVVVARNAHPLRRVGSLAALRDQTWLFPGSARSGSQPLLQAFRSLRLAPPDDVILCASLTAALRIIQQSDALAFVSRYMFSGHPFAGRISPLTLKENLPVAKVVVLTRRSSPLTHPARQFVDCLRDAAGHLAVSELGADVKVPR